MIGPVKDKIHDLEELSASLHPSEFYAMVSEGHTHECTVAHVYVNSHIHLRMNTNTYTHMLSVPKSL